MGVTLERLQNNHNNLMSSIRTTLMDSGWTDHQPSLLPQQWTTPANQELITPHLPSNWNAASISKHAEILAAQAYDLFTTQHSSLPSASCKFIPNEVKVVTKTCLTNTFTSTKWQAVIDKALKFELNKEQEHAYCIVANHSCSELPDQLTMNPTEW